MDDNNLTHFFESLDLLSESEIEKSLVSKAKELEITKRAIQNDYKAFCNARKSLEKIKRHKESVEAFNKMFKIQGITLPSGYTVSDGYLCHDELKICKIFTFLRKIQTSKTQFLEFASLKDNRMVDVRDMLKSDRLAVEFGIKGEYLDSRRAQLLSSFIASFLIENEANIEKVRGADRTGWNEFNDFDLPNRNKALFIDADLKKRFSKKGTLAGELELLKELSNGHVFLLTLFALSATLYKIIDIPINFIAHVGGLTGEGKSFAIKTAMAFFGAKDLDQCGKNWNATLNGLETYWERVHCIPAWVDEMESARSVLEVVSALYVFSEGTGKSRAFSKDGEVSERAVKCFKGTLFTSGEKSLNDIVKTTGEKKNKPLGIVRRSLDFSSSKLWDKVSKKRVAELIDRNHGNFIDYWITNLKNVGFDVLETRFYEIMEKQNISLDGKEYLFALMELVLELLRDMNVIDLLTYEEQIKNIKIEIQLAHKQMNEVKNDYINFLDDLNDFLSMKRTEFKGLCENEELRGVLGKYEVDTKMLFINNHAIDEICSKHGYVWKQIREKLYNYKILTSLETKKQKFMLTPMRCYIFDMGKIENALDEIGKKSVVEIAIVNKDGTTTLVNSDGSTNEIPF